MTGITLENVTVERVGLETVDRSAEISLGEPTLILAC
jgi:hypothetical protein